MKCTGIFRGMSIIAIEGKFLNDPEQVTFSSGTSKVTYTLYFDYPPTKKALEEAKAKNQRAENERVFLRCEAWGKAAENILKYGRKGKVISSSYEIHASNYEKTGEDGTKVKNQGYIFKVKNAADVNIFEENHWEDDGEQASGAAPAAPAPASTSSGTAAPAYRDEDAPEMDELPF